mmetsp:Transcript_2820/g.2341  ORF Transcript_2820/g.2341 Transcript_2820/m.2341 type:complete len:299 (+) Transcript_2820:455-1351(+)
MKFKRVIYFDLKRIEYFLGFIYQMYVLIYIKSVSTLILLFAVLNLIIVIIGTIYNYWKIINRGVGHTKYRYVCMGIIYGLQHIGTALYFVGFIRNNELKIFYYILLSCPIHFGFQYFLFKIYVKLEETGIYYGGDPQYYTSWKYMSSTMLSAAFTTFINPIHQIIWISLGKTPLKVKILPFVYWTVSLIIMLLVTISAQEPVVLIIALCINVIAYVMTIIHAVYSAKMERVETNVGNVAPIQANYGEINQVNQANQQNQGGHNAFQNVQINAPSIIDGIARNPVFRTMNNLDARINGM